MNGGKRDVYGQAQRYFGWKQRMREEGAVPGLSPENSKTLLTYVADMEIGTNISPGSRKGPRSMMRLNSIRTRINWMMRRFQEVGISDFREVTARQITEFFTQMRNGAIPKQDGRPFRSVSTYASIFCAFWHWHMRVSRRQGTQAEDITVDIDRSEQGKSRFIYITKSQLDELVPYFDRHEQLVLLFCFDSMIRSPTELLSLRARDIYEKDGEVWLNIPDEIAKGGRGRTFNLVYCAQAVLAHIREQGLRPEDYIFNFPHPLFVKKLQKVAVQVFGDGVSDPRAGERWGKMTLYDLRHSGAIHFRILAKENPGAISLDAVRERGGWADFTQLNNYTRFLGIDGKIERVGLLVKEEQDSLQKDVRALREENQTIRRKLREDMKNEMNELMREFRESMAQQPYVGREYAKAA